ncbi:hypothetical protein [Absidia glauca]|uniref:GATA-type domain-containing protein n=1 Tax=Absidia glauca TaxID=4829 RepID=A0A163ITR7_ABSGL|nr:hypothetical protein [Absidia glauca]
MTVKSPFYNKPSTSTSVDSCHKCPFIPTTPTQDSQQVPSTDSAIPQAQQQDQSSSTGFEQRLFETSNNDITITNNDIEPCSSSATTSDNGTTSLTSCSNCGTTTTPLWRRSPQGEIICNACGLYLKARNTTRPPWLKRNSTKRPVPFTPVALAPAPIAMKVAIAPAPIVSAAAATTNCTSIAPAAAVVAAASPLRLTPTSPEHTHSNNDTCIDKTVSDASSDDDTSSTEGDARSLTCFNCNTSTTPLWRRDGDGNTICNACGLYYKLHNVHRPITMKRSIIKRRKRVAIPATMSATPVTTAPIEPGTSSSYTVTVGNKRKSSLDHHDDHSPKRMELHPLLPATSALAEPIEPNVFHNRHHHLPSPPLQPVKSCNLASLLNPSMDHDKRLPPISLPSLPSPPMAAHDSIPSSPPPTSPFHDSPPSTVAAAAAAAFATVSALLNPNANREHTHQMLEAHRHELQREVSNLTSMLTRTTAMLENLDQVMSVTGTTTPSPDTNSSVLQSILALSKATS